MIEEKLAQDILVNINFWEADWKNSSREISSQEMSTSCIPTSRNAEFGNFYFTNNRTCPLLTWMRNLKTNSPQSLLRSRLFHYHESLSMLERNVHLYKTEDLIWSATLTCFDFYYKHGTKKIKKLLFQCLCKKFGIRREAWWQYRPRCPQGASREEGTESEHLYLFISSY